MKFEPNIACRGKFITFEGPEGAGKSTQVKLLEEYLKSRGVEVICTREPGGTPLAEQLRLVVKQHSGAEKIADLTELLLMEAARVQHVQEVISPALDRGCWVICDRYSDSTCAYQGGGRKMDMQVIAELNALAMGECVPDLTLLLDLPVALGFERTGKRLETQGEVDRFEQAGKSFHEDVRSGFLALAAENPERIKIIDSSVSPQEIAAQVKRVVDELV